MGDKLKFQDGGYIEERGNYLYINASEVISLNEIFQVIQWLMKNFAGKITKKLYGSRT